MNRDELKIIVGKSFRPPLPHKQATFGVDAIATRFLTQLKHTTALSSSEKMLLLFKINEDYIKEWIYWNWEIGDTLGEITETFTNHLIEIIDNS